MRFSDIKRLAQGDAVITAIVSYVMDVPPSKLFPHTEIPTNKLKKCLRIYKKCFKGVPLAYQIKKWHFMGREFYVNKNVLVPRQDTEHLVVCALMESKKGDDILDVCTGSGVIAISLALEGRNLVAADISKRALKVAKKNSKKHECDIEFIRSDMFSKIGERKFSMIVSNPPYVKIEDIGRFDKSIIKEPRLALDGGGDGLKFYRIIAEEAGKYLTEEGVLIMEIGHDQGDDVQSLFPNQETKIIKDINGLDRVIIVKWKNQN